ncbi:unnamed protein product, partial [Mesorhabditis spiculigera]
MVLRLLVVVLLIGMCWGRSKKSCCLRNGVSEECATALCDPNNPPGDVERYSYFDGTHNCTAYLNEISGCLTDGRDSTQCCARTARDPEEQACFGMCAGDVSPSETYRDLISCIALNLPSIYDCILKSYSTVPTQPQNLRIEDNILRWEAPKENVYLVEKYKVHVTDLSVKQTTEIIKETKNLRFDLSTIKTGTRYTVYIVAESSGGRSQSSEQLMMGGGHVEGHTTRVLASAGAASVILGCTIKSKHERASIEWERKNKNGDWNKVEGISKKMTTSNCTSMCTTNQKRRQIRPGAYLPYHNCSEEMHNLMQCTIAEAQSGPCCIFKKVPYQCLGLCDRSFTLASPMEAFSCLNYFNEIMHCHEESFKVMVSDLLQLFVNC